MKREWKGSERGVEKGSERGVKGEWKKGVKGEWKKGVKIKKLCKEYYIQA